MIPHHTTGRLGLPLLLCVAIAGLSSCKLMRKNYTVMADRVSPAQADEVMVERSGALPPIAPATAPGAPPAAPAAAGSNSGKLVTVQPGDTLSRIAARHGVSTAALMRANGMTPQQADHIRAGQKLSLPGGATPAATKPAPQPGSPAPHRSGRSYTVKPGDTISRIAARHGVSTAALLRANGMTPRQADHIRAGQKLHIPAK